MRAACQSQHQHKQADGATRHDEPSCGCPHSTRAEGNSASSGRPDFVGLTAVVPSGRDITPPPASFRQHDPRARRSPRRSPRAPPRRRRHRSRERRGRQAARQKHPARVRAPRHVRPQSPQRRRRVPRPRLQPPPHERGVELLPGAPHRVAVVPEQLQNRPHGSLVRGVARRVEPQRLARSRERGVVADRRGGDAVPHEGLV